MVIIFWRFSSLCRTSDTLECCSRAGGFFGSLIELSNERDFWLRSVTFAEKRMLFCIYRGFLSESKTFSSKLNRSSIWNGLFLLVVRNGRRLLTKTFVRSETISATACQHCQRALFSHSLSPLWLVPLISSYRFIISRDSITSFKLRVNSLYDTLIVDLTYVGRAVNSDDRLQKWLLSHFRMRSSEELRACARVLEEVGSRIPSYMN